MQSPSEHSRSEDLHMTLRTPKRRRSQQTPHLCHHQALSDTKCQAVPDNQQLYWQTASPPSQCSTTFSWQLASHSSSPTSEYLLAACAAIDDTLRCLSHQAGFKRRLENDYDHSPPMTSSYCQHRSQHLPQHQHHPQILSQHHRVLPLSLPDQLVSSTVHVTTAAAAQVSFTAAAHPNVCLPPSHIPWQHTQISAQHHTLLPLLLHAPLTSSPLHATAAATAAAQVAFTASAHALARLPPACPTTSPFACAEYVARSISCASAGTLQLALHCWRRLACSGLAAQLFLVQGVSARPTLLVAACVYISAKLEEKRMAVPHASQLAAVLHIDAKAVCALELLVMQALAWAPYCDYSACCEGEELLTYL